MRASTDFDLIRQQYLADEMINRKRWQQGYDQLMNERAALAIEDAADADHEDDDLEAAWDRVLLSYDELEESTASDWEPARANWEQTAEDFRQCYLTTADVYWPGPSRPGWLQGFTDHITAQSEGWVEGMGHATHDSEGWMEGMGHATHDSEGWTEGMDEAAAKQ